jgi:hypothetical protein
MSDNAIALLKELTNVPAKYATPDIIKDLATAGWIPYIQIMATQNELVAQGKFSAGTMTLVKGKERIDLTKEFNAFVVAWRPKAMQYKPETISFFNPNSDEYKQVAYKAKEVKDSNCGVGGEFLLYLPDQQCFATFFFGNATARNEIANVLGLTHTKTEDGNVVPTLQPIIFQTQLIKNKRGQIWYGPQVKKCELDLQLPDFNIARDILVRFKNPVEKEVEVAETETRDR